MTSSAAPPGKPADAPTAEDRLRTQLAELRSRAAGTQPIAPLIAESDRLLDEVIAYGLPMKDDALVRELAGLRRALRHWNTLPADVVNPLRPLLNERPALVQAVALAVDPADHVGNVYATLGILSKNFADRVLGPADAKTGARKPPTGPKADLNNLVAAFCVTHDVPAGAEAVISKGKVPPVDVERITELFNYFSTNISKLAMSPAQPPQVLSFIVKPDDFVSIEDLNWALRTHQGNRAVGKLYSSIVYDTANFKRGTPKKVEQAPGGLTLQNIKKYGGVCEEQALFASNIGRAIGVPAVFVFGTGSDISHAWVGYLKSVGNNRWSWDFTEGRYDEYDHVVGNVTDPQTGRLIPDSYIGLTAGMIDGAAKVELSNAFFDAAERLAAIESSKVSYPPTRPPGADETAEARPVGVASQIDLIELGLRQCHVNRRGWSMITALADRKALTPEQTQVWADHLIEMCGREFADFAFDSLRPMFFAVNDVNERDRLWEWAAVRFQKRKDLVAAANLWRGDSWHLAGNPTKAWTHYNEVIERFPNDGQIVLLALERGEKLLKAEGKPERTVDLYKTAWSRIKRPKSADASYLAGCNYAVVGERYAALLEDAGNTVEAKRIRDAVASVIGR